MVDEKLLLEIKEYCDMNDISDIDDTVNKLLRVGFNITKYGTSPFDNVKQEINKVKIATSPNIQEKEEKIALTNINPIEDEVKPKKTIRILKNK